MMRFLLFGGENNSSYRRGAADLLCIGDDLDEMTALLGDESPEPHPLWSFKLESDEVCYLEWWHILDMQTASIVAYGGDKMRRLDYPDGPLDVTIYDRGYSAA